MNKDRIDGICEACEAMHKFCLIEGMENVNPLEQRAYTKMIIFLNNKFGKYRNQKS